MILYLILTLNIIDSLMIDSIQNQWIHFSSIRYLALMNSQLFQDKNYISSLIKNIFSNEYKWN